MHAIAGEGIEIGGEGGNKGLAFTRAHFRDAAFMQHHAANQLHIEMALAEHALGGFAYGGEGRHQQFIQRAAGGQFSTEFICAGAQSLIREGGDFGLQSIDGRDLGLVGLQPAIIG